MLKTKLYDKLNSTNRRRIKKKGSKELISLLKTKKNIHFLLVIDMLMVWHICNPNSEFDYHEFKLSFESTQN